MATSQANLTEIIAQIAAAVEKVAVQATPMASAENNQRAQNVGPKIGDPLMRQSTFNFELRREVG